MLYLITIPVFGQPVRDTLKYKTNPNYELQTSLFGLYKTRQADIIMLGNSLTAGADWGELLGRSNAVGRGIPGDIIQGYTARLDYILKLKPKIVFILGGLNDIYGWTPVEEIFSDYVKLIQALRTNGIVVVIQSTTYAGRDWGKGWGGTPENNSGRNKEVDKLNNLLFDYAKKNNMDFINLNAKTAARDGFLRPELTYDGIHFNSEGYKIWVREVERVLIKYKM
jgi:lysophospholipase L1-like esterase